MVAAASFAFLLSGLALYVNAEATPTEPGPGSVFNQGSTCRTSWEGDKDGKWAGMSIQLMTGDNQHMVHLTTVGENLDGNKDGKIEFECPEVDPYSAIYFFQYSAPEQPLTWATRFAIADKTGKTVAPAEDTQPDGAKIPWGTGKLVDASSAKPPPSYLGGTSSTNSSTASGLGASSASATSDSSSSSSSSSSRFTTALSSESSAKPTGGLTSNASPTGGNAANTNNTSASANNDNGALSLDFSRPWQGVFAVAISALLFL
ncbi:hypothetical protein V5O48_008336 [Marasmius crinis-equi]|uniref:Uncharacterized protein n=1 Tax=Marasmius crinis-equi TaxID=585013 RepID=A0ABR3FEI1_9AGAR